MPTWIMTIKPVHQMARWQNDMLTKCNSDKMTFLIKTMVTKCQVDKCQVDKMPAWKMPDGQNVSFWAQWHAKRCQDDKMSCWLKPMSTKCHSDKMLRWQNAKLINVRWTRCLLEKCQMDKMSPFGHNDVPKDEMMHWLNTLPTKCHSDKMPRWKNAKLTEWRSDEMTNQHS